MLNGAQFSLNDIREKSQFEAYIGSCGVDLVFIGGFFCFFF